MKADRTVFNKTVHRHLSLLGSPSVSQVEASRGRIHERLRAHQERLRAHQERLRAHHEAAQSEAPLAGAAGLRYSWRVGLSLAAAATVIALVVMAPWQGTDWLATVHAADGSMYTLKPNEVLRASADGGAMLTLRDGSSVEMRAASELSVERAGDGLDIRLNDGDIIIEASKQRDGHLYVHTRDVAVAVEGTVFVANAGNGGSRVAVIEGEVRVRDGAAETRLGPGEEVATSLTIARRPLTEDIIWSRNANSHLAILESFKKGLAQTAGVLAPLARQADVAAAQTSGAEAAAQTPGAQGVAPEFEEASVRQCDPDNLPPSPVGARGGGANSLLMTPGHFYVQCMTLANSSGRRTRTVPSTSSSCSAPRPVAGPTVIG